MKRETLIIIFYIVYFTWLLTVTFIATDTQLINLFTLSIAGFYFLFLKEKGDVVWFLATILGTYLGKLSGVETGKFKFDINLISAIPLWLPLAWGTTIVALRKFFIIINVAKS